MFGGSHSRLILRSSPFFKLLVNESTEFQLKFVSGQMVVGLCSCVRVGDSRVFGALSILQGLGFLWAFWGLWNLCWGVCSDSSMN